MGSVEEPLVGVISEFEDRKHKLRVLQVERGVPDEVSYRCEDLKGGKVVVRFRAVQRCNSAESGMLTACFDQVFRAGM